MKVIVIDPVYKTVEFMEIDQSNTLKEMQSIVGGYIETAITFANGDTLFVNEEGLLVSENYFFKITGSIGRACPFAGKGVIVGTDDDGDTVATSLSIEDIKENIFFMGRREIDDDFMV